MGDGIAVPAAGPGAAPRPAPHHRYDVAIIGAGMSGLAAGIRLAHFGRRVVILEKHGMWGGLNSFYKKDGRRLDVGLHAVTNWFGGEGARPRTPLERVLRQLRIPKDAFELEPQRYSQISFPETTLRFSNDLAMLTDEVARAFPNEVDAFRKLVTDLAAYPSGVQPGAFVSTRERLTEYFRDEGLIDMLLCPLLFYGSAWQHDLDFGQFVILFNSIYREGFCRPRDGVRTILDVLVKRFRSLGGALRRHHGVASIEVRDGRVQALALASGGTVEADWVISSAGRVETAALRSDAVLPESGAVGQLGFVEFMWDVPSAPAAVGYDASIQFFCRTPRIAWRKPDGPVDLQSGVICAPSNFLHAAPLPSPMLRATHLARPEFWAAAEPGAYQEEKMRWADRSAAVLRARVAGALDGASLVDAFTPRTVARYTSHVNGAVYGSPKKSPSGATDLENLVLCGTDQGFVGIVGAMVSGVAMANRYVLTG